jgi:hypothetical protein
LILDEEYLMSQANADPAIKRIEVFSTGSGEQPGAKWHQIDLAPTNDQVPGIRDAAALRSSFAKVRALKEQLPDLVLLPAHDPRATDALMQVQ